VRVAGQWLDRELGAEDVEPLTWALAERAAAITADDYLESLAAVSRYRRRVQQWWHPTSAAAAWDLLLTPTLAGPPPRLGEMAQNPDHPFAPFARAGELAAFTPAFNTTGQPAISLPMHVDDDGLPVGVQLVAAYGREDVLVRVAAQLEAAAPWADRHPHLPGA
jgi:amidase